MKILSWILAILLLVASCVVAFAAPYYLDTSCANNGTGLGPDCAASGGGLGAFNTPASVTGLTGADVSIYGGTTIGGKITLNWASDDANCITVNTYNRGYQGLAKPIFDSRATVSGWSQYGATAIYSASVTPDDVNMVSVDDVGIQEIAWNTNIATTAAGMSACTFTQDNTGNLLYVWACDGTDPTDNVVKYATETEYIRTESSAVRCVEVDGLSFKGAQRMAVNIGWDGRNKPYSKITNSDFTLCGDRCASVDGNRAIIKNITCSYASTMAGTDQACVAMQNAHYGEFGNITVANTLGSCIELNGDSYKTWVHDLNLTNCGHAGIETFGCGSGACVGSRENTFERFVIDNTSRVDGVYGDSYSAGVGVGNNAYRNIIRNGKISNVIYEPLSIRCGSIDAYDGYQNKFYNITINSTRYAYTGRGAISDGNCADSADHKGGNEYKNILVNAKAGGRAVYAITAKDILTNNLYYAEGGSTVPFKYNDVDYSTLAAYQAGYASATGLVDASIYGAPLIDMSLYAPASNSPALGIGLKTLGVNTDFNNKARSGVVDAGAVQTSDDNSTLSIIGVTVQ